MPLLTVQYKKRLHFHPRCHKKEAFSQEDSPDETEQILFWIRKKGYDSITADQKETERLLRFLIRKGYSYADIRNALEKERIDTTSFNV